MTGNARACINTSKALLLTASLAPLLLAPSVVQAAPGASDRPQAFAACSKAPSFAEDFRGPLAPKWTVITHAPIVNGNRELQAYRADNLSTGRDGLRITARRNSVEVSSGRIASQQAFRYGCFEIEAKMPAGKGLWPAIWLRTPYGTPINGEIDIMEGFGSHPGVFQGTVHYWDHEKHLGHKCTRIGDVRSSAFAISNYCSWAPKLWSRDFTTQFHRYGVVWQPGRITWLIDGEAFLDVTENVTAEPMNLHLNMAVGGVFDGAPDATTPFPAVMQVRKVSVYPLK
jgi:beta-glucanase (GH16 family)